ncbi:MAG: hypothetical protein A3G83_04800 [Betaproteobacteria bacterium RIFCSPLOWO2_12_FULL_68_20]|nr:MAG: hypothetical protein A3G83_04800 [Betaproteobacteria bacterium RIFCSPLOWO2_12_FULL_68_20]
MSRARLRAALASRATGEGAVVPLIGAHAARLEQVSEAQFRADPEMQARALRNAQALYATDAVTVGAALDTLAAAVRSLPEPRPEPARVLAQAAVATECEAMRRLRPVLAERAGIAIALPGAARLAARLGAPEAEPWCAALLLAAARHYCTLEPDLLIVVGAPAGPRLAAVCTHFGVAFVQLAESPPPGVSAVPGAAWVDEIAGKAKAWLYTTTSEIPADADPRAVKAAIDALRS